MTLTIGSLFSGVLGGLELGLERAGLGPVKWQVELDDYATCVLEKHWPDTVRHRDVREVGAHNLEPVDLICGGFPCTDISTAGERGGIEGEQSGLWREYARIVREIRPLYVVVENVAALLYRGFGRVAGDLAALGYDLEWDCIPAAAVGAPHLRDRVFVVAHTNGECLRIEPRRREAGGSGAPVPSDAGTAWIASDPDRLRQSQQQQVGLCGWSRDRLGRWPAEPDVARVVYGLPGRLDRERCLGNSVCPPVAEIIGRYVARHAGVS